MVLRNFKSKLRQQFQVKGGFMLQEDRFITGGRGWTAQTHNRCMKNEIKELPLHKTRVREN